jgi:HEPN domain-containing protein
MQVRDKSLEWLRQAAYDFQTAEFMMSGGRYFYAVFMCHLAVEKALKGLHRSQKNEVPPKTHNLIGLLTKIELKPPEQIGRFLAGLNEASILTRYPETLEKLQADYTAPVVAQIISRTRETLEWLKTQY